MTENYKEYLILKALNYPNMQYLYVGDIRNDMGTNYAI